VEDVDGLALFEDDDRLLPVGALADGPAHALYLAANDGGPNVDGVDVEEPLHGCLDLVLVRATVHLEGEGVVRVAILVGLFGHDWSANDFVNVHDRAPSSCFAAALVRTSSERRSAASRLNPSAAKAS